MNETVEAIKDYIRHNDNARKEYGSDICATYKREERLRGDYRGRQIFELLQNADDCGEGSKDGIRVKFRFAKDGDRRLLAVANTGKSFSAEGVNSLLAPDDSPKDDGETIGNMGLGFRSVLNWTSDIKIVTGAFTISFSEEKAKAKLKKFRDTANEKDKPQLDKIDRTAILSSCSEEDVTETDEETARNWLEGEYSTAILLYCDDEYLEGTIQSELKNLCFEELLFLKHTTEIEIDSPKCSKTIKCEKTDVSGCDCEKVTISGNENDSIWYVWRRAPSDDDVNEDGKNVKAEIVLAYNKDPKAREDLRNNGCLYSYFKTDERMPFPLLVHADFALTTNRKAIWSDNAQNRFVFEKLADFMCETSLKISRAIYGEDRCDYTALSALIPSECPSVGILKEYGFFNLLSKKVKTLKIFPSVNGKYRILSDKLRYSDVFAKCGEGAKYFADVLEKDRFPFLLKRCDDSVVRRYIENNVRDLVTDMDDLNGLIDLINEDAEKYVKDGEKRYVILLDLLLQCRDRCAQYHSESKLTSRPRLFLDADKELIQGEADIFFSNEAFEGSLPNWAHIAFMDPDMQRELEAYFESNGETIERLSQFGCGNYVIENIADMLMRDAGDDVERIRDLLGWFYKYWTEHGKTMPSGSTENLKAVSQSRESKEIKVVRACECYMGRDYGCEAAENVTKYIPGVRYLESVENFAPNADIADLKKFLRELGVCEFPRFEMRHLADLPGEDVNKFLDYMEIDLSPKKREKYYPLKYSRYCPMGRNGGLDVYVSVADGLGEILDNADFYDVLHWLLSLYSSEATKGYIENESEGEKAYIRCAFHEKYARYDRSVTIQGRYVYPWFKYKIATTPWIPAKDKKDRQTFSKCTIRPNKFSPSAHSLDVDEDIVASKMGWNPKEAAKSAADLFRRLDMPEDVEDLPRETIYRILLELEEYKKPVNEANIEAATGLYKLLNDRFRRDSQYDLDYLTDDKNAARTEFFERGKILAKIDGGYEYRKTDEVYYIENTAPFGNDILKTFPTLDISSKRGEDKNHRLFNVKKFGDVEIALLDGSRPSDLSDDYDKEFRSRMTYVYIMRLTRVSEQSAELSAMKSVHIELYEEARIETRYEGRVMDSYTLDDYKFFTNRAKSRIYVTVPNLGDSSDAGEGEKADKLRKNAKFVSAVSDAVAAYLGVSSSDREFILNLNLIFSRSRDENEDFFKIQDKENSTDYLKRAEEKFPTLKPEEAFWKTVESILGDGSKEIVDECKREMPSDFDYDKLNADCNLDKLNSLLGKLGTSVSRFNESPYCEPIDFSDYFDRSYEDLKDEKEDRYLYTIAKRLAGDEKKTINDYEELKRKYEAKSRCPGDDLNFDINKKFEEECGVAVENLDEWDDAKFNEMIDELSKRLPKGEEVSNGENVASEQSRGQRSVSNARVESEYDRWMEEVDDLMKLGPHEVQCAVGAESGAKVGAERKDDRKAGNASKHEKTYDPATNAAKEENGFKAEAAVYKKLEEWQKDGKIRNLRWHSGNAKKANMQSGERGDTLGYDISYFTKKAEKHYVEVKESSGPREFTLTSNEYEEGKKLRHYDVWFVSLNGGVKFCVLKDFFRLDGGGFSDRGRYSVSIGSFSIKINDGVKMLPFDEGGKNEPSSDEKDGQT